MFANDAETVGSWTRQIPQLVNSFQLTFSLTKVCSSRANNSLIYRQFASDLDVTNVLSEEEH
eukprot:2825211-Lingulodinium_polyedra.AAC.1